MSLKSKLIIPPASKPTAAQLTSFAIALARRTGNKNPAALVKEALAIWDAANAVLVKSQPPAQSKPQRPVIKQPQEPAPEKFPLGFENFLRLILPNRGRADRYHIFRAYLEQLQQSDRSKRRSLSIFDEHTDPVPPEPTDGGIGQRLDRWRSVGIPTLISYRHYSRDFRDWYARDYNPKKKAELRATRAKSALIGKAKQKLREHLWQESRLSHPSQNQDLQDFRTVTDEEMANLLRRNEKQPLKDYKNWDYHL